jgi:hypothetical protein
MSAAAFTLYRMRQRARAPEAERVEFADAIRLCQTVSAFDPTSPQAEDGAPPEPAAARPDTPVAAAPGPDRSP